VDTTPGTTSLKDAVLRPGKSFYVDLGASVADAGNRFCTISVGKVDSAGRIPISVISTDTSAPTFTFSPTTASPTLRPTLNGEKCSSADKCCSKSEITVPGNDYFTTPRTFRKLEPGDTGSCCPDGGKKYCSFQNVDAEDFYLQYMFVLNGDYYFSSTLQESAPAPLRKRFHGPEKRPYRRSSRRSSRRPLDGPFRRARLECLSAVPSIRV
jgi:hypothetical protein